MISEEIKLQVQSFKQHQQTIEAIHFLLESFQLEEEGLAKIGFRHEQSPNSIIITTEGEFGQGQTIAIPSNFLDFDLALVVNLLAYEILHVRQKTIPPYVLDKNEREWQAYYENLFHEVFPQVPAAPYFNQKQFAQKALVYYDRMGENGDLQIKYALQKQKVENLLSKLL